MIDIQPQTTETECYCKCPCNPTATTTTTPSTTTEPPPECEPNVTGYFPDPVDVCQRYLYCSRGTLRFFFRCDPGTYFTPGNNRCTSDVPPGCEYPDARVMLYGSGEPQLIDINWGECYNLEDIDMADRVSSVRLLKNDCISLCDTNQCDGTCIVIEGDNTFCGNNLSMCEFDKRAKSMRSCLLANQ